MRAHLLGLTCSFLLTTPITICAEEQGTWPFVPAKTKPDAPLLLDLRGLNEEKSGEHGFIRLSEDGNSFVRGDGEPIRFWAVGSDVYRQKPEEMDRHCRFLARLGVNMVRLHTTVANTKEGAAITDVNQKEIDGIFRFIKAAKENGIYVTISPYYGHHETPKSWRLDGYGPDQRPWGAIFIDPRMQEGYKAWTRALYTTKNPHTGLAIKDDPTVAILQIHNEDSLFFWTAQRLPEPQMERLAKSFAEWLEKKHGSLANAHKAWDGHRDKGDDFDTGKVALMSTWHLTQDWEGGLAKRIRDQVQFLGEYQRGFYADMGRYLREELGCRQLLNATNWRTANDLKLKDIERWTYAALDIDAENEYYGSDYQHVGENKGYRIDPGHYLVNESCLHKPLELTTNFKSHIGHPFIVTETSWKHPNLYQSEGPFLVSAYQSLNGVDAVYWFSANTPEWLEDPRRLFWKVGDSYALDKWSCSTPMLMGMFPAAALVYRQGYVREGEPVVTEYRTLDSLWNREPPQIDDNEIYGVSRETEECGLVRRADGRISRVAFLVGPVRMKLGAKEAKTEVADFTEDLKPPRAIRSNTYELWWGYHRDGGDCTMNTPKAQGVAGFLCKEGNDFSYFGFPDVVIETKNTYASISVVSLDDQPLKSSRKVLVQVGTTARLKGWKTEPATFEFQDQMIKGERIVHSGSPPWQIANTEAKISVKNPHLKKATLLTVDGYAKREVPTKRKGESLELTLPKETMYLILSE